MSYDIITFGSAAQDIHVKSEAFKIEGKGICLPFGSKIEVEDVVFTSGGGGTNTAVAFAKQGFRTAFCGAIGADMSGLEIIRDLKHLLVDTRFVVKKKEKHTNYSIVMSNNSGERTILVYRGASDLVEQKDVKWNKVKKTSWFYLAPLGSPKSADEGGVGLFGALVDFAKENKINIAINPSKQQLSMPENELKNIFRKVDILFLNQEEASFLTKIPRGQEGEMFKKISEFCSGIIVITKGVEGVVVADEKYIYSAGTNPNRKIVDTTGAGDSFASGFLSDYIRQNGSIEKAIQLGIANSEACLSEIGAKNGLLDKNSKFIPVQVVKTEIN